MTLFQIVGLYVALNLIILLVLFVRTSLVRLSAQVSLGHGDNPALLSRIRAHANFVETSPFVLIGLISMASLSASPLALHLAGGGFTAGRILHMIGMNQAGSAGTGRRIGSTVTLLIFAGMAIYILYLIFFGPTSI